MLRIFTPEYCDREIRYVLDLVFKNFWGIEFTTATSGGDTFILESANGNIHIPGTFFRKYNDTGLEASILPRSPLPEIAVNPVSGKGELPESVPLLYGNEKPAVIHSSPQDYTLSIDIFGSVFFMLTRFEEYVYTQRDNHDRFPVTASLAYRNNFIDRPLVNEYLEILWSLLEYLNPGLRRSSRTFRVTPGHDIDVPFMAYRTGIIPFLRYFFSELNTRRRPDLIVPLLSGSLQAKRGDYRQDPFFTFDYIMKQSEKRDLQSRFYLIADSTGSPMDGTYAIDDPEITGLLGEIHKRGHEIALHCSYESYRDGEKIRDEYRKLVSCCERLGIRQEIRIARQHYLRFSIADTWRLLDQAGIRYDESLTFAGSPGFRCGTCYEYPVFDLTNCRQLDLIERPLIVMDSSVLLKRYIAAGQKAPDPDALVQLKNTCRKYNGTFNLLWHNNHLTGAKEREMYEAVLDA